MSYILDALKKAERERDIRNVPTLMAEHEPAARGGRRLWAVFGALAICAGGILWFILFLQKTMNPPQPSSPSAEYNRAAREMEAPQSGTPAPSAAPAAKTKLSADRSSGTQPPAPRAVVPAVPLDFPAPQIRDDRRLQQMAEIMAAAARQEDDGPEDNFQPDMVDRPQARIPPPRRPTKTEAPADQGAKEKSVSLKEALNEMTLSILLYDENKADRMVFINGRKYVEGDYIEDAYLLESITLDGAYLIYRGERALLQPKAK